MIRVTWLHRSAAPLAVVAALGLALTTASAQQFPAQDIHFFCGFPPGSGADVLVRYFAEKVRPLTGKNIIVENKVGAGGNIAMEHVARSKPDGYNVFVQAGSGAAAFMSLRKEPSIDVAKQIQIAGTINRQPYMIAVLASNAAQDARRSHRGAEGQGREGKLRLREPEFDDHRRVLQADAGSEDGRSPVSHRPGHGERRGQRTARFRLRRSGAGAEHAPQGRMAHPWRSAAASV